MPAIHMLGHCVRCGEGVVLEDEFYIVPGKKIVCGSCVESVDAQCHAPRIIPGCSCPHCGNIWTAVVPESNPGLVCPECSEFIELQPIED